MVLRGRSSPPPPPYQAAPPPPYQPLHCNTLPGITNKQCPRAPILMVGLTFISKKIGGYFEPTLFDNFEHCYLQFCQWGQLDTLYI